MTRLYLDNAATSFPKPPEVWSAMAAYAQHNGASPGRGHYAESREGARLIRECRERLSTLLSLGSPSHIIFALNTSDALNLAIKGVVRAARLRGRPSAPIRLVTTAMDHNSVLRPFAALADEGATVVHVNADPRTGRVRPEDLDAALAPGATLAAINAVSNVTGTIQPCADLVDVCRRRGVPSLVDAAQALGHTPVSMADMPCDLLAFPGHKGLLGPQGTGGLAIRPGFEPHLATTREGGTGHMSELDGQPDTLPEKYEAGSHNAIGIVGLSEGVRFILARGQATLRAHELDLITRMLDGLRSGGIRTEITDAPAAGPLSGFRLLGPVDPQHRTGTFSLVHDHLAPGEVAALLESQFGILARAGLHCAPRAHATVGTFDGPARGAIRFSMGPFVTPADVTRTLDALTEIAADAALLAATTPRESVPAPALGHS